MQLKLFFSVHVNLFRNEPTQTIYGHSPEGGGSHQCVLTSNYKLPYSCEHYNGKENISYHNAAKVVQGAQAVFVGSYGPSFPTPTTPNQHTLRSEPQDKIAN